MYRPASVAEFDHPDSDWNVAAAATPQGDPFCCRTEWQLSFRETFGAGRPVTLRRSDDSVVAFSERIDRRVGRVLEPIEASWLFGCPLLGRSSVELLARLLDETSPDRDLSVLVSGLIERGSLQQQLVAAFADRYEFYLLSTNVQVSASLDGGLDGYLSRRSGRLRRNVRAQQRRAATRGVTFERCVPTTAAAARAAYRRMLAVEARSWKGIGACGMAEPPSREFYDVMMQRLATAGAGRVVFARHADDDVGFIFGGVADAVYRGQQFSFVEEWRDASIGNLLQLEQLRWLTEEGVARYDMGPSMAYKRHWTELETRMDTWLLRPRAR